MELGGILVYYMIGKKEGTKTCTLFFFLALGLTVRLCQTKQ